MSIWQQARQLWKTVFSNPLTDAEKQVRLNFLRRMLPAILVVIAMIVLTRFIIFQTITLRSLVLHTGALATIATLYLTASMNRYYLTMGIAYLMGSAIIIANALTSPPHADIFLLVLLPLFASMLLSFQETILWSLSSIITLIIFGYIVIMPVNPDVFNDMIQQSFIFNVFILFGASQRNRLERDRQQLAIEKERSDSLQYFLTSISHDFRTPLSIINSSAYLLQRSLSDEKQLERLTKINNQTKHLDNMVTDIVTLSRLEYGVVDDVQTLDLVNVVNQAIENLRPLSDSRNLSIHKKIDGESFPVAASYEGLNRIIVNLLENAIKFTEEGSISIRLYHNKQRILFEIEDTGTGIAEDDLSRIFDPFFRTDAARSRPGSGLGLSLVKKTLCLFDATIEVSSQINQGSCFRVSFPLKN